MARALKFRIQEVKGLYKEYLCSENKSTGYCAAYLSLCFRICKKSGFLMTWHKLKHVKLRKVADLTACKSDVPLTALLFYAVPTSFLYN